MENVSNTEAAIILGYRFEDSVPILTSDGKPHGTLTLVASLLGVVAAIIVLIVLTIMLNCRRKLRLPQVIPLEPDSERQEEKESENQIKLKRINSISASINQKSSYCPCTFSENVNLAAKSTKESQDKITVAI